jgi:aryl-alcohol dehydrogenase-like predicted oxidoreductase
MCKDEGTGIIVWSALGGGKFKRSEEREADGKAYNDDLGGASVELSRSVCP